MLVFYLDLYTYRLGGLYSSRWNRVEGKIDRDYDEVGVDLVEVYKRSRVYL